MNRLATVLLLVLSLSGCVSARAYYDLQAQFESARREIQELDAMVQQGGQTTPPAAQTASAPMGLPYGAIDGSPFNQVWIGWHPSHPFPDELPTLTWSECAKADAHQCRTIVNESGCAKIFQIEGDTRVIWRDGVPMPGPEFVLEVGEAASFILEDPSRDPYISFAGVVSYHPLQKGRVFSNHFPANSYGEMRFADFCGR